ncbi:MAG: septal ring lytic transglycosylase RlpA family protein [Synergistaceae bacterium]|jgi:rare lipoprotein A|nr:septal ring lytic transglycosylase RlpA family protein [Synergistaceae bacterium]
MKQVSKTPFLILSAFMAAVVMIFSVSAAEGVSSSYVREGKSVLWKFGETNVWRFPESQAAEVSQLTERFNALYAKGFALNDLHVAKSDGKWSVWIGNRAICAIAPEYAKSAGEDARTIALRMMSRIYEIICAKNAAELTKEYQIKGKYEVSGSVSWFGGKFIGRKFANGEKYTENHLAAAAKTLPFGTLVRVAAPSGKTVVLRVTDRFKGHKNRVLDISVAAAELLGVKSAGTSTVNITVIGRVDKIGGK